MSGRWRQIGHGACESSGAPSLARRRSKYGAERCEADGYTFDSKAERSRYFVLKTRQGLGEIQHLEVHPRVPLGIRSLTDWRRDAEPMFVGFYEADFQYHEVESGAVVLEDVKCAATRTPVYRLKVKLVKAMYGIDVREVL